ncbi:unnamed protein product [Durusdinium trenchii]
MLVAEGMDLLGFTQHFMACSQSRAVNGIPERTRHVKKHITVKDVLSWMGGSLASRWERYSTLFNNCQHFQAELQTLLFDESGDFQPPRGEFLNRALALESIRQDPTRLVFFPQESARRPGARSSSWGPPQPAETELPPNFTLESKCKETSVVNAA